MKDKFALASVFAVAFLTGCISPAKPVVNMKGMAAPDFELARLDGK